MTDNPELGFSKPSAMLLLEDTLAIDKVLLFETLHALYPNNLNATQPPHNDVFHDPQAVLLPIGDHLVALLAVNAQLPEGWREIAERSPHWPNAVEICAKHRAHLIVAEMDRGSDMLACSRITSAVAGTIARLHPESVLAGMWGAKVLNSAETWTRLSATSFNPYPDLPTSLWVSQHPFDENKNGDVGVLTRGLDRFVGRELELVGSASNLASLLNYTYALTTYLVENGSIIRNGSTFGTSPTERIVLSLCTSERFDSLPIISGRLSN